jgi:hypothetical protein
LLLAGRGKKNDDRDCQENKTVLSPEVSSRLVHSSKSPLKRNARDY